MEINSVIKGEIFRNQNSNHNLTEKRPTALYLPLFRAYYFRVFFFRRGFRSPFALGFERSASRF